MTSYVIFYCDQTSKICLFNLFFVAVAYIYVGDFLTSKATIPIHRYDIRQQAIVDILSTTEVKERLEKLGHMKPPLHMLAGVGPSTRSSSKIYSAKEDAGPSLQESPDFLEDLPDNHYEEEEEDQSPKITRNHSQIISCDLPPDYEYDAMSSSLKTSSDSLLLSSLHPLMMS